MSENSLAYATRGSAPRQSAAIVSLAIISLLLGLSGGTASVYCASFMSRAARKSTPPAPPSLPSPLPAVQLVPWTGETVRPEGFPRSARERIIQSMAIDGILAEDRRAMGDRLLAEIGKRIIGEVPPNQDAFARVPGKTDDLWAAQVFTAPKGTVEITATTATFTPSAQGQPFVAHLDWVGSTQSQRFSLVFVDHQLAALRSAAPQLTSLQAAALVQLSDQSTRTDLTNENGGYYLPARQLPFYRCQFHQGGLLTAFVGYKHWIVLPDGRSIPELQAPQGIDPARGAPRPLPRRPFVPYLPGSPAAMWALAGIGAVNAAAAVFLTVSAILMLAGSVRGRLWHVRWAALKYPLVIAEVALGIWFLKTAGIAVITLGVIGVLGATIKEYNSYILPAGALAVVTLVMLQLLYPTVVIMVMTNSQSVSLDRAATEGAIAQQGRWRLLRLPLIILAFLFATVHVALGAGLGFGAGPRLAQSIIHIVVGGALLLGAIAASKSQHAPRHGSNQRRISAIVIFLLYLIAAAGVQNVRAVEASNQANQPTTQRDAALLEALADPRKATEAAKALATHEYYPKVGPVTRDRLRRLTPESMNLSNEQPLMQPRDVYFQRPVEPETDDQSVQSTLTIGEQVETSVWLATAGLVIVLVLIAAAAAMRTAFAADRIPNSIRARATD